METTRSSSSPAEDIVDSTPLLGNSNESQEDDRSRRFSPRPSFRGAVRFFGRASSGGMLREPSMLVRETAAEHLEERQSDWAYSRPVVFLDIIWNSAFVIAAIVVLILSRNESPPMPLRLWIIGYALQCILHMVLVCVEYRRRSSPLRTTQLESNRNVINGNLNSNGLEEERDSGDYSVDRPENEENTSSVAKHLESLNTLFSFIWWIIGFYWVAAAGQEFTRDSPRLYWLCIVFLAFDVFFVIFCVALACVIGIAVCCCLPCIIALLYSVTEQEGASKDDIDKLPKYRFRKVGDFEKLNGDIRGPFGGIMTECDTDTPIERILRPDDSECCICLSTYDDGAELHELPCGHHFHCACIDKWLYINATCPLCKYNLIKGGNHGREEV